MKRLMAVLLAAAFGVVGWAGPAGAQTTGNQRFIVVGGGSGDEVNFRVIAIGPITAVGTFEESEDPDVVRFVFPQGTVTLDSPTGEETEEFDERTCTGSFTFTGPFTITGATGAFQGATGSGQVRGQGRFIGERTANGCSEDEDAGFFFLYATATGNVTVPARAA
jgi:hypothetical protein